MQQFLKSHPRRLVAALSLLAALSLSIWSHNPGPAGAPVFTSLGASEMPQATAVSAGERLVPSSRSARPENAERPLAFEESFIRAAAAPAQASQKETGVPASVTLAQAILESDWGRSWLSRSAKNFFGIKARPDPGPAGIVYKDTWENIGGRDLTLNEPFRAYNTMEESFVDHGQYLLGKARYQTAFKFAADPKQFAREIHKAGYATDPAYSTKLVAMMDKFNLYEYDLK